MPLVLSDVVPIGEQGQDIQSSQNDDVVIQVQVQKLVLGQEQILEPGQGRILGPGQGRILGLVQEQRPELGMVQQEQEPQVL